MLRPVQRAENLPPSIPRKIGENLNILTDTAPFFKSSNERIERSVQAKPAEKRRRKKRRTPENRGEKRAEPAMATARARRKNAEGGLPGQKEAQDVPIMNDRTLQKRI